MQTYKTLFWNVLTKNWTNLPRNRGGVKKFLPAGFNDAGDESLVGHFAEADAGKLEFAQEAAGSACKLAAIAEADDGRVLRHFIEGVDCGQTILDRFCHI